MVTFFFFFNFRFSFFQFLYLSFLMSCFSHPVFIAADRRDDLSRADSDKFNSIFSEVENLHQLGIDFFCEE